MGSITYLTFVDVSYTHNEPIRLRYISSMVVCNRYLATLYTTKIVMFTESINSSCAPFVDFSLSFPYFSIAGGYWSVERQYFHPWQGSLILCESEKGVSAGPLVDWSV